MIFKFWLEKNNLSYREAAIKFGVSKLTIMKWANHRVLPTRQHIDEIAIMTRQEVTLSDFYYVGETRKKIIPRKKETIEKRNRKRYKDN